MLFHSAIQACRPNRTGEILRELKLPALPTRISVRAVTLDGARMQLDV
jgi:hypothetical protein